ncbi:helix-turn-helix domain-containing protein [Rhodocytophaga aerolata]|uniref:Helix-turn-helix domain-containing protein n=1 Tax=Rhodocytophaga aerolata TaxID=455078 RepID=A0ABT8R2W4_9BACT|nr:helix-turn-helix domain-containing protein [Rhodocytophaga aerolata]MDO1446450.1 helix-turn-helix domain-containing protein [Rhodocytophaga aerolata]
MVNYLASKYQSNKQQALLQGYIKSMLVVESGTPQSPMQRLPFFADGLPGIVISLADDTLYLNGDEKKLPEVFVYGQTVKPIDITAYTGCKIMIIYLYPHVLKSLFGIDASLLADTCLDVDLLKMKGFASLKEQIADCRSTEEQKALLGGLLTERIHQQAKIPEKDLHYATDLLLRTKGNIPLQTLYEEVNLTERTFERKFLAHVGITPSLFSRICRFQAAITQLRSGKPFTLTAIAYDNGFADQSHMGRTFKEFTGLTPAQYQLQYQMARENW